MKASVVKTKTFSAASAAALDTAIGAFLVTLKEAEYLQLLFSVADATTFCAMLVYAT